MKENIEFTIILKDNPAISTQIDEEKQRTEFHNYLESSGYFINNEIIFIHKDDAAKNMEKELGENFMNDLVVNPLKNAFEMHVNSEFVSKSGFKEIKEYIGAFRGDNLVHEYNDMGEYVDQVDINVQKISMFLLLFCIIFLLISFALINNNIRLAIYSKRLLIRTMRLVGATNKFIQKPYLNNSIYQGFFSGIVSIIMIIGVWEILKNFEPEIIHQNDYLSLGIILGLMLIFGIIISWISTFFAVRKYLNLNENELYN